MKKEKRTYVIDSQDHGAIYENLVFKLIDQRQKQEEREKAVILDKISIHFEGKELILENSKA